MITRNLYYRLKPFLPYRLRWGLRRWRAGILRDRCKSMWPVDNTGVGRPDDWEGWPDRKQFALVLTHDVESGVGLRRTNWLAELETKHGFHSSFNFIPEGDYELPDELRSWLVNSGFEVGVHDLHHDGKLYRSRSAFARSAERINHYLKKWGACGFRSGFMLRRLDWLHQLDIEYDASTFDIDPFEPQPGGVRTIFPFMVDQEIGKGYVELPYTLAQDSTLFFLLGEKSPDVWKKKLDWIVQHGGMVLLNLHPDFIQNGSSTPSNRAYPARHYEELLDYIRTRYDGQFWNPLPRELAGWYRKRSADRVQKPVEQDEPRLSEVATARHQPLRGRRAAVVVFSYFPFDPRPRREAEALVRAGMEVDYLCLHDPKVAPSRETRDGINVVRLPVQRERSSKARYIIQYASFLSMVTAMVSWRSLRRPYDLVHAHNMPDVLVFSGLFARLRGAKLILDLHDPMPELMTTIFGVDVTHFIFRLLKLLERTSIGFSDLALTPNVAFKDRFVSRGADPNRIRIVMNSPEEHIFKPVGKAASRLRSPDGTFRLMYHGSLVERHGLDTAIRAVGLLHERLPGLRLDLYGHRTDYVDQMEQLIQELGLMDAVTYQGSRNLKEIAGLIGEMDLGLVPNKRTPFTEINMPTRLFELLSMGRPVIAPDTKGIRDYFKPDEMIFFNPDSVEDLAAKIEWAFHNPKEVQRKTELGQAVYRRHRWVHEEQYLTNLVVQLLDS